MRTKEEVQHLIVLLERFQVAHLANINSGNTDESMAAFNNNSTMLCALRWVMGEDTITSQVKP